MFVKNGAYMENNILNDDFSLENILVTKDINLRMKARSLDMLVEDYITDKVINIDAFSEEELVIEGVDADLIDKLYSTPKGIDIDEFKLNEHLEPNQCFILKSERNTILVRNNPFTLKIVKVDKKSNFGITEKQVQARHCWHWPLH